MPCDNIPDEGAPKICQKGGGGLLLPILGDWEQGQDPYVRAAFYLMFLLWSFGGVSIVADVFMGAIEHITSQKVLVDDKALGKKRTATVWNPTVANLTLMALGSSAPEILLNVVGIFPTFLSGELGPSTIVGSAAFNLMIIIGVCVISLPNDEIKKIKDLGVYTITATFSLFAYLWVWFILTWSTPDVVEAWEGIMTFMFFWLFIIVAYLADIGMLPGTSKDSGSLALHPDCTKQEWQEMEAHIRNSHGGENLSPEKEAMLIQQEFSQGHSRAVHRVNSSRLMTGGKRLFSGSSMPAYQALLPANSRSPRQKKGPNICFDAGHFAVKESVGKYKIKVHVLCGPLSKQVTAKYVVRDGTAVSPADYSIIGGMTGELKFGPRQDTMFIEAKITRTKGVCTGDKDFFVELLDFNLEQQGLAVSRCGKTQVVILDEDRAGSLAFEEEQLEIEASDKDEKLHIMVVRKNGSCGKVTCKYKTESVSAIEGADFQPAEGLLEFANNEQRKGLDVMVNAKGRYEATEQFRIVLTDATGGANFDDTTDGGRDSAILTVIIQGDEVRKYLQVNWDKVRLGNANWKDQLVEAFYVGGSHEEQLSATFCDWVMHLVNLPWKVLSAVVPPTQYCGGWVCFMCALGMVGFVTVLIGDAAELLGCCIEIPPATTAITLVALGTSLPDTFASRTAAKMDPDADNCVGNVTGSNSVNVFLGLGLPWTICGLYWTYFAGCTSGDKWSATYSKAAGVYPTGIFVVEAGSLGTSVAIYSVCAVMTIFTLAVRRAFIGGEIGGPKIAAYLTCAFFVSLWLAYVVLSILSEASQAGTTE